MQIAYLTAEVFLDALSLVLSVRSANVDTLVSTLLTMYNQAKTSSGFISNDYIEIYVTMIEEVFKQNITINDRADKSFLLLKIKGSEFIAQHPDVLEDLTHLVNDTKPLTAERYDELYNKVKYAILLQQNRSYVDKIYAQTRNVQFTAEKQRTTLTNISAICSDIVNINNSGLNSESDLELRSKEVDFSNRDSISKALHVYKQTAVVNVFKTGLQGLNRALGSCGGFKLGESIIFNALSYNFKSSILLKFAKWVCTLNQATSEFKNPTCLFYSLENEAPQNLMLLFRDIYIEQYKQLPPPTMTDDEITDYCYTALQAKNWRLVIQRRLGSSFGFPELVADFEGYLRAGYTPLVCIIDYMNMMKKGTNADNSNWLLLRELYTNLCNYTKSKNCTLISAHQLNRRAAELVRINPVNPVKRFGIDVLADGMDPQREVDVSIYMHKEVNTAGEAYLTFKLDKHRYDTDTPDKYKFFAYRFTHLGIPDDIDGPDMSLTDIYSDGYHGDSDYVPDTSALPSGLDSPITREQLLGEEPKLDISDEPRITANNT